MDRASTVGVALAFVAITAAADPVSYTDEATFLAALLALPGCLVEEGFEDDAAWGSVRSTIVDGNHVAPRVAAQGLLWEANNPASGVTTGPGPARSGSWGFYELPHGDYFQGLTDGFVISAPGILRALGGWFKTNTPFAKIDFLLDDVTVVDFGDRLLGAVYDFYGVIDPAGFQRLEVRELEGTSGDQKLIFADDFEVVRSGACAADLLLVDDDGDDPDVRAVYTAALDGLGMAHEIWDTGVTGDLEPAAADLTGYARVLWFTGGAHGGGAGPESAGEASLADFLDGGGCLLLSSQDHLDDHGLTSFVSGYLGVGSATQDVDHPSLTGLPPVFGFLGTQPVEPAFVDFSDAVTAGSGAGLAFQGTAGGGGVVHDGGSYRATFLAFPLSGMPAAATREAIRTAMAWCDRSCSADFDLDLPAQTIDGVQTFQACDTLRAGDGVVVSAAGDAAFQAGHLVVLASGFRVEIGGTLRVLILPP